MSKDSQEWEMMESTFLKCLHEIERSYVHLPKSHRIRVEKWIEKLVATGDNSTWRKHRNAYARLLLNMTITRQLSEPFNLKPPEGPLPPLPFHFKSISKDLLGPHESTFWRGLYDRLQDNPDVDPLQSLKNKQHSVLPRENMGITREIDNLNLLVTEQNERIQLLEQQLHEERVKHELQLQRLHFTHRSEINQLLAEMGRSSRDFSHISNVTSSLERRLGASTTSPFHSHQSEFSPVSSQYPHPRSSFPQQSSENSQVFAHGQHNNASSTRYANRFDGSIDIIDHYVPDITASPAQIGLIQSAASQRYSGSQNHNDFGRESLMSTRKAYHGGSIPTSNSLPTPSQEPLVFQHDFHQTASGASIRRSSADSISTGASVHNNNVNDNNLYSNTNNLSLNLNVKKALAGHEEMVYADVLEDYSTADIRPFPKSVNLSNTLIDHGSKDDNVQLEGDEDFLNYLDKFQDQIRTLNENSESEQHNEENIDQLSVDSLRD
jgi:hypothetical protein